MVLFWSVFCKLDTSWSHLRRRNFSWENSSIRLPRGQTHGSFSWLITVIKGPTMVMSLQDTLLGCVRKKTGPGSKQHFLMATVTFLLQAPPGGTNLLAEITLSSPSCFWAWCLSQQKHCQDFHPFSYSKARTELFCIRYTTIMGQDCFHYKVV